MTNLKIAFITLGYYPYRMSGLDVSGERLVKALTSYGHNVTIISGGTCNRFESDSNTITIHRIRLDASNWIGFSIRAALHLERLIKKDYFDVIHFWDVHFAYGWRGKFISSVHQSFRQRIQFSNTNHYQRLSKFYYVTYCYLSKYFAEIPSLNRSVGIMAVSNYTRDEYITNYHVPESRIIYTPNGINTNIFTRDTKRANELKGSLGIDRDAFIILFVGFITPRKGMEYLFRAISILKSKRIKLLIIGRWSNLNYRRKVYESLNIDTNQILEIGYVNDDEMSIYYSMADVYVSASLLEGFGLPLAEALSCQTPVIATDVGATAEVVGEGGILVPPRDSMALAEAIRTLLMDEELRILIGKRGRKHIEKNFNIQQMVNSNLKGYLQFYNF